VELSGITVALDAMGGDHAPEATVAGALDARDELGVQVVLVGREPELAEVLRRMDRGSLPIRHAPEVVGMEEEGAFAVREREGSSLMVAAGMVKGGEAQAMVSAGNTGAAMAAALLTWGRMKGAKRPAVGVILPPLDSPTLLLDAGANADCRPEHLRQFAILGSAYVRARFGMEHPRVGLLNIGSEESKGNQLAREAFQLLRGERRLNFVGNVEGRDILTGRVDVVVTDGFTGNVTLKVVEGVASAITRMLLGSLSSLSEQEMRPVLPALLELRREMDYRAIGGAPLLGVKGVCIIAHGSSDSTAIKNSIRAAAEAVAAGLLEKTEEMLAAGEEGG